MLKKTLKAVAVAALAVGAATSANALTLFFGQNQFEDDNRELLIDVNQNGQIDVGDALRGVIRFQAINQIGGGGSQTPIVPELTGIFESRVDAIVDYDGDGQIDDIVFGASAAFTAVYGAGAMVAIFEGGPLLLPSNLDGCANVAACEAAATDGTHLFTFGLGDADDQWVSLNANLNFAQVSTISGSTTVAGVNFALSMLLNNSGYVFQEQALDCVPLGVFVCAGDGMTDLVGQGSVLGGRGLTNGYGARSDIDAELFRVPEPGSLALFGLALAGLGMTGRRRKS